MSLPVITQPTPILRPISLVVALVLLLSACSGQAADPSSEDQETEYHYEPTVTIPIDSSNVRIVNADVLRSEKICTVSEEPITVIGDNEDDESHFFSLVRGLGRLSNGSVVALNRREPVLRIFDATGTHLRSTGANGDAPGEFANAYILWVTSADTIYAGDYRPWRYNVFTAEGEFVRQVRLSPDYLNPSGAGGVLDNGYTVNERTESPPVRDFTVADTMIVEVHDSAGKLVGSLAKIPDARYGTLEGAESNRIFRPLFESRAEIDARGTTIALAQGSKAEVRVLDDEFNLKTIIRWSDPVRKVTGAHIRTWREEYEEYLEDNPRRARNAPALSSDRPVAEFFPILTSVQVGRDGRIWIKLYDRPRPAEERGWLAFDSNGDFSCRIDGFPGVPYEIGADYVLLLHEPDKAEETIRVYGLTSPS